MRVTFDTHTLDPITRTTFTGSMHAPCAAIHDALKSNRLTGFVCETVFTVEGGGRPSEETLARVRRALDLGLQILSAPRIGLNPIGGSDGEHYVKDADETARSTRLQRYESIAAAIEARGLGFARALKVARRLGFSESELADRRRVNTPGDARKVARAISEWADGDAVAAHYGYENDLFCTEDRGVRAGQRSVMHPRQRGWLQRVYGVRFVSMAELAVLICAAGANEV